MLQKLSTLAWRYVFWRTENDFLVAFLRKAFPGLLAVLFFVGALSAVLPQTTEFRLLLIATAWLSTFIFDRLYADRVWEQLRETHRPKYRIHLSPYLYNYSDTGGAE